MKNIVTILLIIISSHSFSQNNSITEYHTLIKKGDSLLMIKNYQGALYLYEKAGQTNLTDELIGKIQNTQKKLKIEEGCDSPETSYTKIVAKADELFNQSAYLKAKKYYERALLLRPNDIHVTNRIKEIESIINDSQNSN